MNELDLTTWEELMELASLTSDPDAVTEGLDPITLEDPERLADFLRRLSLDDRFEHALRQHLVDSEGGTLRHQLSQRTLANFAAKEMTVRGGSESGQSAQTRGGSSGGGGGGGAGLGGGTSSLKGAGPSPTTTQPPPEEPEEEDTTPKIRAWKVKCEHTIDGQHRTIEEETSFQVVPDANDNDDKVVILYRDDFEPPPPTLTVRDSAGNTQEIPQGGGGGGGGGYVPYELTAKFLGDRTKKNILGSDYWSAFNSSTTYNVELPPTGISVRTHYPHKWKLEFAFPAMKSFKGGSMLKGSQYKKDEQGQRSKEDASGDWATEETGWSPSSLTWSKSTADSKGETSSESHQPVAYEVMSLTKDGQGVQLNVLEMIGDVLKFADNVYKIMKDIKDMTPKVGWYMDANVQLMKGGLACEWGWKEHTDKRAYRWINLALEMTVVSIGLEMGIGIEAGFKAQVYLALEGSLKVKSNLERTSPDGEAGLTLGPVTGAIVGKVGARFEVGNYVKANAEGSTGFELSTSLKLNQGSKPLQIGVEGKWLGLKVEVNASYGLFGISGKRQWTKELAKPSTLGSLQWPKNTPYNPPYISRSQIKGIMQGMVTSGWNVRVRAPKTGQSARQMARHGSYTWKTPDWIAEQITDKIDPRTDIRRDNASIKALAHEIRQELNKLGERSWQRDYIEESQLQTFLNGELNGILKSYIDPPKALANSLGATP